jgi:hypothetical protein
VTPPESGIGITLVILVVLYLLAGRFFIDKYIRTIRSTKSRIAVFLCSRRRSDSRRSNRPSWKAFGQLLTILVFARGRRTARLSGMRRLRVSFFCVGSTLVLLACSNCGASLPTSDGDGGVSNGAQASDASNPSSSANDGAAADASTDSSQAEAGSLVDGGPGALSLAQGCTAYAAARCAYLKQCRPFDLRQFYDGDADCESWSAASCMFHSTVPDTTITGADQAACAAEYTSATCNALPSCTFGGTRQAGATCQYMHSCASGGCSGYNTKCGTCLDYALEGEACSSASLCDPSKNLFCGGAKKCVKLGALGEACGAAGQPYCSGSLVCVKGKCAIGAQVGQPCGSDTACDVRIPAVCDSTTRKCVAMTFPTAGARCGDNIQSSYCSYGECVPNATGSGKSCRSWLPEGAACDPTGKTGGTCRIYLRCSSQGKCSFPVDLACK